MPEADNGLVSVRLEKLARLRATGIDPFSHKYSRSHTTAQARAYFESQVEAGHPRTDEMSLAGRIVACAAWAGLPSPICWTAKAGFKS